MTFEDYVEHLFATAEDRHGELRLNPVTSSMFYGRLDPLRPQKQMAVKALEARAWFEPQRPPDAAELPLGGRQRSASMREGVNYIVAALSVSLERRNFETEGHPCFNDFARGAMASPSTPAHVRNDPDLLRRYPPTPLPGLSKYLIWYAR
jgi:hypothetical protein